jgi:nondiscriminating aspartyl-tRNA synthetase
MKIDVKDLKNYADKEIVFEGFVDAIRDIKWVQFVVLRDSTGKVQMTIEKSLEENKGMVELISSLPLESTVRVNCKVVLNPNVKLNGMELIPSKIVVTSRSENELPFNYKDLDNVNLDTRLDYRFIDLRNDKNMKIFQIQSVIVKYMREYLYNNKFML